MCRFLGIFFLFSLYFFTVFSARVYYGNRLSKSPPHQSFMTSSQEVPHFPLNYTEFERKQSFVQSMEGQAAGETRRTQPAHARRPIRRPYASASRDSIPPECEGGRHPPPPRMQFPAKCLGLCFRKSPTWQIAHRGFIYLSCFTRQRQVAGVNVLSSKRLATNKQREHRPSIAWKSRTLRAHNEGKQKPVAQAKPHRIEHFNT